MNDLNHFHSLAASIDPDENNIPEQLPNTIALFLSESEENFSLSNYEDDDDDSGFCCPCCLPR